MKTISCVVLLVIVTLPIASAISVHTQKTMVGVGYTNADTIIETHADYSAGHAASIAERGSGIVNDTIELDFSTQNKTLSIHTDVLKEYSPVIYNDKVYNKHWEYDTLVKNYIVGTAINSAYENSQTIQETSDWILNKNETFLMDKTKYLGESHFGIRVVDPANPKNTIMDSFRDAVGLFTEDRVVVVTNDTSPHSLPITCP